MGRKAFSAGPPAAAKHGLQPSTHPLILVTRAPYNQPPSEKKAPQKAARLSTTHGRKSWMPWHQAESSTDVLTAKAEEGPRDADAGATPQAPTATSKPKSTENSAREAEV